MLTAVYVTARVEPEIRWFLDSLRRQMGHDDLVDVIIVDLLVDTPGRKIEDSRFVMLRHVAPMPNVWQGVHRLMSCDTWAAATARNTGICLAQGSFIAFCDDRSVLGERWLEAVREAKTKKYAVAGAYQKVYDLKVEDGRIAGFTHRNDGIDFRIKNGIPTRPIGCRGSNVFGATLGLPLEWALEINGFDETTNTVGLEDCMFGRMLANAGKPIKYDYRMLLVEDRTPEKRAGEPKRKDKGVSPNDKSHGIVAKLTSRKKALHERDLRAIRTQVLGGGPWPIPTGPTHDWWDGEQLKEMTFP